MGPDADGSDRHRRRQRFDIHFPRQRPWTARQLDRVVRARRARAAAHYQCVGDVDLQRPHSGAPYDRRAGRRAQRPAGRDRRIPDRRGRNL